MLPFDISIPAASADFAVYANGPAQKPEVSARLEWLGIEASSTR
jgi:hypothetical protein